MAVNAPSGLSGFKEGRSSTQSFLCEVSAPNILLLQGPAGPFFSELQNGLEVIGISTRRVIFNAGDVRFGGKGAQLEFNGNCAEWEAWLRFECSLNKPDFIIMFGSSRPIHRVARHVAQFFSIEVLSLEEGYLRTGYITCEVGGNNQHSPFANWCSKGKYLSKAGVVNRSPCPGRFPVFYKSLWAIIYYLLRDILPVRGGQELLHRTQEHPVRLALSWLSHAIRRTVSWIIELPAINRFRRRPGYILIPLQVSTDSQICYAARGWNNLSLVKACIDGCARLKSPPQIVVKLHPLERDSWRIKKDILRRAKRAGLLSGVITVISSGRIGELAQHSSGMVVINSTSAFSALHHNVPVLVLGDAIYRHQALVTLGESAADVLRFFKARRLKDHDAIQLFIDQLKVESLLPGDFYDPAARQVAVSGILEKIQTRTKNRRFQSGGTL